MTVSEVIQKEHFDVAIQKVLMGNSITSLKNIQRINFLEIFEKINGVEDVLKQDPSNVYPNMDWKTKEYYRNKIKEISEKTKISEIYIARKILEIAKKEEGKKSHIGYYLIDKGIEQLYDNLKVRHKKTTNTKTKAKQFVTLIVILTVLLSVSITLVINYKILKTNSEISTITRTILNVILGILLIIPCSEIVTQIVQYILSKTVKPKLIPKMNYQTGIPKEQATMVVIPTIVKTKEKVKELMKKLEIYYIANKSENLYFTLLGDCSESNKEEEEFDKEVIEEGKKQIEKLNKKYSQEHELPIFNFIYRKRIWNEKEESYLGWERKRGMLNQLNEYLLKNINNPFLYNSIEEIPQIKYIITLDADTDLVLNTAQELIGAMSHILNKPIIDKQKNIVVEGYGIMQPRVGINLDVSLKTTFTKIFAGAGGIDNYTNAISDIYQDNFKEGKFTIKGIYHLKVFTEVLKNEILGHEEKTAFRFYIIPVEQPTVIIGVIGLNNVIWGAFCSAFLGYKLDKDFLNKGYMTMAVEMLIKYAFEELGLHRIEANVMPKNKASLRVLEKNHFMNEGLSQYYLNINGSWEDHIHMVKINYAMH